MERNTRYGFTLAAITMLIWGTLPFAGKLALEQGSEITVPFLSFVRLTFASTMLGAWMAHRDKKSVTALRRPPLLVIIAVLGLSGNYLLYYQGLQWTTPEAAQLVFQIAIVLLFLWGVVVLGEKMTPKLVGGSVAALLGVALVTWNGQELSTIFRSRQVLGNLIIMGSAVSWVAYAITQKHLMKTYSSVQVTLMVFAGSAVVCFLVTVFGPFSLTPGYTVIPLIALIYLSLNTLIAYTLFGEALKHLDASAAGIMSAMTPVVALLIVPIAHMIWPIYFPSLLPTWYTLGGAVLVVGGLLLVVTEQTRRARPEEEE